MLMPLSDAERITQLEQDVADLRLAVRWLWTIGQVTKPRAFPHGTSQAAADDELRSLIERWLPDP